MILCYLIKIDQFIDVSKAVDMTLQWPLIKRFNMPLKKISSEKNFYKMGRFLSKGRQRFKSVNK